MKFTAWLWSVKKDRDGEVKVTFCVPKTEAKEVMELPEETNLLITIEPNETGDRK